MTTQIGPGLRRRQLAAELTRLRAAAGKDQMQAAETLDCSRPRISNLESGRAIPSKLELPALLSLYGASERLPVLEELRVAANEPGWWSVFGLPIWLQAYVRLESDAKRVRCFALELVPGLAQVESYARESYLRHGTSDEETDRHVAARLRRPQRLVDGDLEFHLVMSEALLCRTTNMGPAGRDQLQHLGALADMPNITMQVLPFASGGHRSMAGSFTLLDFPVADVPPVAYLEYSYGGHLADDDGLVTALAELHHDLGEQADTPEVTRHRIQEAVGRTTS